MTAEVETLLCQAIEDGKPLIPVVIDDEAEIPELLRARSRCRIEQIEDVVDAILERTSKPKLGPAPVNERVRKLIVQLETTDNGSIRITTKLDGVEIG